MQSKLLLIAAVTSAAIGLGFAHEYAKGEEAPAPAPACEYLSLSAAEDLLASRYPTSSVMRYDAKITTALIKAIVSPDRAEELLQGVTGMVVVVLTPGDDTVMVVLLQGQCLSKSATLPRSAVEGLILAYQRGANGI